MRESGLRAAFFFCEPQARCLKTARSSILDAQAALADHPRAPGHPRLDF
jgi:hypothetical protein